jgi:hypothetical protein
VTAQPHLQPVDQVADVDRDEDDFLAFWAQHQATKAPETKRIFGVDVVVPTDIPLVFGDDIARLQKSERAEDMKHLLTTLFGAGVMDQWIAAGCTGEQFGVLLAWGMANAAGKPTTFAEAADLVAKAQADAEGKARNRAARRASSKTVKSGGTGGSSKRTSRANTA